MNTSDYAKNVAGYLNINAAYQPWKIIEQLEVLITEKIASLGKDYYMKNGVAIHKTATIEPTAEIKGIGIIGPNCLIGPHTIIRGGVILFESVSIGPGCEVKHSVIGAKTSLAHFNFVGDSIIGVEVNFEAGAITANYYNEREDKTIFCVVNGIKVTASIKKFGALIGDDCKLGANSVTSPGTILTKSSVVKRLELIEQVS